LAFFFLRIKSVPFPYARGQIKNESGRGIFTGLNKAGTTENRSYIWGFISACIAATSNTLGARIQMIDVKLKHN
jgi:hypothetical protein